MAKVRAPFYSMEVSGAIGDLMFDRRGFIRRKGRSTNPKTAKQGNARQPHNEARNSPSGMWSMMVSGVGAGFTRMLSRNQNRLGRPQPHHLPHNA